LPEQVLQAPMLEWPPGSGHGPHGGRFSRMQLGQLGMSCTHRALVRVGILERNSRSFALGYALEAWGANSGTPTFFNGAAADAYFGRAPGILRERAHIKRQTIQHRRLQHRKIAA